MTARGKFAYLLLLAVFILAVRWAPFRWQVPLALAAAAAVALAAPLFAPDQPRRAPRRMP